MKIDQSHKIESSFDFRSTNEQLLLIYELLLDGFKECEGYGGPYQNMIGIFFHEFMYHLCTEVFRINLIDSNKNISNLNIKDYINPKITFLSNRPLKNIIRPVKEKKIFKYRFTSALSHVLGNKAETISIVKPTIDLKSFLPLLFKSRICFNFIDRSSIFFPFYEKQWKVTELTIKNIYKNIQIRGNSVNILSAASNTLNEIKNFPEFQTNTNLLLTGTPGKLNHRILAANALSQRIPVICVSHGNESGLGDELTWGFDDRSFCTHLIGYGKGGEKDLNKGKYIKPLSENEPEYIRANSNFIKDKYKGHFVEPIKFNKNSNYLYISNGFDGNCKVSPFLNPLPSRDYLIWQKFLFNQFKYLHYKQHPKELEWFDMEGIKKIITGNLEDCLDNYDGFIVDSLTTTAFSNVASTSKPIIYFNIGFGNPSPKGEELARKRVTWIDIDYNNPGDLYKKFEVNINKDSSNYLTPYFSLADHNETREKTVYKVINNILQNIID